jgi:hypothetical protein
MAYEIPGFSFTAVAAEAMTAAQFKFAKISADNAVSIGTDLTDIPCGVIQNDPASGAGAVILVSGISKILVGAGGAVVAGNFIGCDAEGCAVVVDPDGASDYYYVGQVLIGAAAGEYCTALINCATPVIQSGS